MSHLEIAQAFDIDVATLRKHFADELKYGASKQKAEVYDLLFKSAEDGNVSAQRKLVQMADGEPPAGYGHPPKPKSKVIEDDPDAPKKKLGKKELQQKEAEEHDETFSPPDPPSSKIMKEKKGATIQ